MAHANMIYFQFFCSLTVVVYGIYSYNTHPNFKNEPVIGCRNEKGKLVDSYVLYKLPENRYSDDPHTKEGVGYMYLSNDMQENIGWSLSNNSIASTDSFPGQTLKIIYDSNKQDDLLYIVYNDEFPDGKESESHGHTKGVVVMTPQGGFWLVHSTPRYPPEPPSPYTYPHTGTRYGQSFLCLSLPPQQAKELGLQLQMNKPFIYSSLVSTKGLYPTLEAVIDGVRPPKDETFRVTKLLTHSLNSFTVFSKYTTFNKDLYADLVAPELNTSSLFVETWQNGRSKLPEDCHDQNTVENIHEIKIGKETFTSTKDHSKWAVSDKAGSFVCVGDINRMASQFHRAGGTVCGGAGYVWQAYHDIVVKSDHCNVTAGQ